MKTSKNLYKKEIKECKTVLNSTKIYLIGDNFYNIPMP